MVDGHGVEDWRTEAERYLESGAPLAAYDILADGLAQFPADVRLRQLLALALARTGASRQAIRVLDTLRDEGHADEETLGMLARAHKDLWAEGDDQAHLDLAYRYYDEAYRLSGGIWSGINAAAMALLRGERAQASTLAEEVRTLCLREQRADPSRASDYWLEATLGEAALILGDLSAAARAYTEASALGRTRIADTASTRRNARLIIQKLGIDGTRIERCFRIPRVVAFAGHLIDRPDRASPRFPPELEAAAGAAIRDRLAALDAGFGYSSAACGADILFLEALHDRQAESNIVLPYARDQFVKDCVDIIPGATWRQRFERAMGRSSDLVIASEHRGSGDELSYQYAVLLFGGMAGLRADELDADVVRLVLWDGGAGDGPGGTGSTVASWRAAGQPVEIVDLSGLRSMRSVTIVPDRRPEPARPSAFDPHIVAMLFADARGFTGLTEEQIPVFVSRFLGLVAATLRDFPHQPVLKNTWGDGLYFVFERVGDAGQFALQLSDAIAGVDWTAWDLPRDLTLRIGLHAGPAYACLDPVTGRLNYFGIHVSRAARIEPITPPGHVYASRAFAALARAEQVSTFRCEYVGRTPLAKAYGTLPMYVVRRRRGAASLVASSTRA